MEIDCIPYEETGYIRPIMRDYLRQDKDLLPYYSRFPSLPAFKKQVAEKQKRYPVENRKILFEVLNNQYSGLNVSAATAKNIEALKGEQAFTLVTGHQLNLFTGPLYFLYKIISTINLCKKLGKNYPEHQFIPIYWMATEDHDFEEISFFNIRGKKIQWNKEVSGAVGRVSTAGLDEVLEVFKAELGSGQNAGELIALFRSAYLEHRTLTDATRYLANELFGRHGLVILDGDHPDLKRLHIPAIKKDVLDQTNHTAVQGTLKEWADKDLPYSVQVNPREINYFYLKDNIRERIVQTADGFAITNSTIAFTREELEQEIDSCPERFSPNVITRPIYQEVILPNLCYIGGGGELAYWLQLKSAFEAQQIPFPILLLRNSALMLTEKQQKKVEKLGLRVTDLFLEKHRFINKKIREISNIDIDFSPQREHLKQQFAALYALAEKTDPSFLGAVKAQEVKQLKGLDHLEKRLLKAQKRKLKDQVVRMTTLQNDLFPEGGLQERKRNLAEFYLELGSALIPELIRSLDPLELQFTILRY